MIPYHGTPCGAFERNRDVFATTNLCLSWASMARFAGGNARGADTFGDSARDGMSAPIAG